MFQLGLGGLVIVSHKRHSVIQYRPPDTGSSAPCPCSPGCCCCCGSSPSVGACGSGGNSGIPC